MDAVTIVQVNSSSQKSSRLTKVRLYDKSSLMCNNTMPVAEQ